MIVDIFDVGHGASSVINFSNACRVMVDAGYRYEPFWAPSIHFAGQPMDLLVPQNLDEDHVRDLPYVLQRVPINAFFSNPTVGASELAILKAQDEMGPGVSEVHRILRTVGPRYRTFPQPGPGEWYHFYWNDFGAFTGTNNLSVPAFFGNFGFCILFGGDLEKEGWQQLLLRSSAFRAHLARVRVLVASHHGRENGRYDELFRNCRPDIVIFSDYDIRHQTQETVDWYAKRVNGIVDYSVPWGLGGPRYRRVLTTRSDGSLKIIVKPDGSYMVYTEKVFGLAGLNSLPYLPRSA